MNPEIFKSYDIRGKVGTDLTYDTTERVGKALADWLPTDGAVAVGYDMRPDSKELAQGMMEGLRLQGRKVVNIGLVSTDMIYFAVGSLELAGGAMITASHNPGEYNGIKMCRDGAVPIGLDGGLADIRDAAMENNFVPSAEQGDILERDIKDEWVQHALSFIDEDKIKPLKIAVDAGNGMAGAIMPVLEQYIPCEFVPLYWELDGSFPNHEANPMKEETLSDLSALIKERDDIDFGMAFDGDGDRVAFVDENGQPVSGSMTFALLATKILKQEPGANIVYDLRMSHSTLKVIEEAGGKAIRSKVGNPNIKRLMAEHDAPLGGETTGHFMVRDNFSIDSGLVAAVLILAELSETDTTLHQFIEEKSRFATLSEQNFEVDNKEIAVERILGAFPEAQVDRLDGVTLTLPDGWLNIRASNTEPLLRLNAEANDESNLEQIVEKAKTALDS